MRKSLAAHFTLFLVIAIAFSVSSFSSAQAMPAPMPGNIERSIGLAQWGAETEESQAMSQYQVLAMLLDLARILALRLRMASDVIASLRG